VSVIERTITAVRFGRILGVGWRDVALLQDVGKLGIAAIVAGLAAEAVRLPLSGARPLIVLIVCGVVFALAYVAAVFVARIPTSEEKDMARRKMAALKAALGH
jgi:hypothetical protein